MKIKNIIWIYRALVVVIFLAVLCRDPKLGSLAFSSFWASEFTIGLWMARGWSAFAATQISTAIGNFADFNWWMIVFYDFNFGTLAKRIVGLFLKFSPTEVDLQNWKYRLRYTAIPIISCFSPSGGVWVALIIARFLRLNKWATLALVLVGNTVRGNFWGGAFATLGTNAFLRRNIGLVTIAIVIGFIASFVLARILRKLPRWQKAPLVSQPQEFIALCCARALL